jgi:transcriptional regulator with XRE-family HTH domain
MGFDRAGFDREVGLRLARARKDRGITQEELARRIGLPRPSYANIESGRQRVPLDVVWRAAIVLGQPIDALVPEPFPVSTPSAGLGNSTVGPVVVQAKNAVSELSSPKTDLTISE